MPDLYQLERLRNGVPLWGGPASGGIWVTEWNKWRAANPDVLIDLNMTWLANLNLRGANLSGAWLKGANCVQTSFGQANLQGAHMAKASLLQAFLVESDFSHADLSGAVLHDANLTSANFSHANLRGANLSYAHINHASMSHADLTGADLSCATFVACNLDDAILTGCRVYGVSTWDTSLARAKQDQLIVTRQGQPTVRVDNLDLAQFVYLLLENQRLRSVFETMGQKAVLVLGRFGDGGLDVLHEVAASLRDAEYVPMIFEFQRPENRSLTETVRTLAGLARFVVVDLSGPSVPHELASTVPLLRIPFVPIMEAGRHPYAMFADLLEPDWVLKDILEFTSPADLRQQIPEKVIKPAEKLVLVRQRKLRRIFEAAPVREGGSRKRRRSVKAED